MLTGQGLIGKLALFIAEKLIGHQLTISLDETKRTCRAFVEFYYCLDRLESLNDQAIETLAFGINHKGILIGDIQLLMMSVNTVSQRFLEIRSELHYAIELIDPKLANSVTQIYSTKGSFLSLLSRSVINVANSQNNSSIEYFNPDPRILEIDMSSYEEWVANFSTTSTYDSHNLEWPQSLLCYGEFEDGFHKAELILSDTASLEKLHSILITHGAVLSLARERIREFISKKFTSEHILYVSKSIPRGGL